MRLAKSLIDRIVASGVAPSSSAGAPERFSQWLPNPKTLAPAVDTNDVRNSPIEPGVLHHLLEHFRVSIRQNGQGHPGQSAQSLFDIRNKD